MVGARPLPWHVWMLPTTANVSWLARLVLAAVTGVAGVSSPRKYRFVTTYCSPTSASGWMTTLSSPWMRPLTLPPCLSCPLACPGVAACEVPIVIWMREHASHLRTGTARRDPGKPWVTPYTQRATELLLEHVTLSPREALGQGMGPLAARAAFLRRAMAARLRLHENLLEVHPRATLIRRFGAEIERRSRRAENETTWAVRKDMLGKLAEGVVFDRVWPELVVRNVHVFYAVIAAMSAYLWARDGWSGPTDLLTTETSEALGKAVGELGDMWLEAGWIWTPPARNP